MRIIALLAECEYVGSHKFVNCDPVWAECLRIAEEGEE